MHKQENGDRVDSQSVQRDVVIAFDYSYAHDDWVFPLKDALAGVTAEEAAWKPGPDVRSIWEIVLHMTVWTENILQRSQERLRGDPPGKPPEGAWPAMPSAPDGAAWENAKQRLWDALAKLRTHIEETPLAQQLDQGDVGYSQFADLLCRFIHNAYHIGQITKLRECREAQGI